jgi:hypothetical protein
MRPLFAFMIFVSAASAQKFDHAAKLVNNLRADCVAAERIAVAVDANDWTRVKNGDTAEAGYCEGFIAGFIIGSNHQPIQSSRHIKKAIVSYIDDHPSETDLRKIMGDVLKTTE